MNAPRRKALILACCMTGAAVVAALGRPVRREPGDIPKLELDRVVPDRFGAWATDPASQPFVRAADRQGRRYGGIYDQVLERTFMNAQGDRIMLSVAFGSEQSATLQMHRPEVCYRAGGFEVSNTHSARLKLLRGDLPITRLQAAMPGRPEPVTYWTVLGGEVVSDADSFRSRRLWFAVRRELVEGLLVRVSSIDANPDRAFALHVEFAGQLAQALPADAVGRLFGGVPGG